MGARLAAVVLGLLALGVGCDSDPGTRDSASDTSRDSVPEMSREPPPAPDGTPWYESPGVVEACREAFRRQNPKGNDPAAEEAFIAQCTAAVGGVPDPGLPSTTMAAGGQPPGVRSPS